MRLSQPQQTLMPRLFHRPPKYRLHKSTKQAVVSFLGKQLFIGPYGSQKSLQRYQELLKEWEVARHEGLAKSASATHGQHELDIDLGSITAATLRQKRLAGSPVALSELILVYRRHTHEYYRKNGETTREAGSIDDALRILRRHHATSFAADFGPVALDSLRDAMVTELDWSRSYINKQVNRIRGMFKWAAAKEIVDSKCSIALKELPGLKKGRSRARESNRVGCVSDAIVELTVAALPQVVADMVRIQRLTSARPGEICSMAPAEIDMSDDVWIYTPAEHKTEHFEKDRIIAIGPKAQSILTPYLVGRHPGAFCFSPRESESLRRRQATANRKTPLSCGNRPGTNRAPAPKRIADSRYTTASYRRAIHRSCEKIGVEKWSPNRLRHTASTEIRKRFGIEAARAVDGHAQASTTAIYAEKDTQLAIEVMRTLG
ncbi:tyrosine-type recombinase/integrase [Lacipirellula sp.]|uniref:tyrosine-type recombinase/integrase n=1 Tax=Lacipirellula sp. TaxID=2691419 RepID=UPI003D0B4727